MIKYDYEITVNGNQAKLNKDIYLFRGNKNVHYYFAVKNASFNFKGSTDLIEKTNAINAAVTVIKPNNVEVASAIAKVENGKIHLKVTEDLIDEEVEVGDFDLVFDLFDDTDGAVTIPKVIGQFHVLERPCTTPISELVATNTTNEVDQALTDYAIVTYAEPVASTNADGTFAKKTWVAKEKITTAELNRMEEGISDVSSQCKDIAKEIENVGQPTQEQINTAIDKAITDGKITGSGGINSTAKILLETILKNAIYTTDQSANITSLVSALSSENTPTITHYTITNTLTKCTNGNSNSSVAKNTSYIATIIPNTGYKLDTVTVTMGGADVTSTVYSNGKITINSVTGNIVITATAIEKQGAEMPTNGLVALFDKDSEVITNGAYPEYQYQIKSKQGDYVLGSWNTQISETNEHGVKALTGTFSSNKQSEATIDSPTTWVVCSYLSTISINGYAPNNLGNLGSNFYFINAVPVYINTNNESKNAENISSVMGDRSIGYHRLIMVIDGNYFKVYKNGKLVKTLNGSDYSDFSKWKTPTGISGGFSDKTYAYFEAVYNRALSDVEVVELDAYIQTLEVNK